MQLLKANATLDSVMYDMILTRSKSRIGGSYDYAVYLDSAESSHTIHVSADSDAAGAMLAMQELQRRGFIVTSIAAVKTAH